MMEQSKASELIRSLVVAEAFVAKESDRRQGVTKRSLAAERKAVITLFKELTGVKPTEDEIRNIVSV